MKRRLLLIASLLAFVFILASCDSKTFTVTFESNGGSTVEAITVEKDEKVTKPADPTKAGYNFSGWYKEESLTTEWKFETDTVTANITLYGKWTAKPVELENVKVTFNYNYSGGEAPKVVEVQKGDKVTKPTDPTRTNYEFKGWYKEATGTTAWNFANDSVTANITLYAKWETTLESHIVTLNLDYEDKTETVTVVDGQLLNIANPIRADYIFTGWLLEGEIVDIESYVITSAITLTATWTPDTGQEGTAIFNATQLIELFTNGGNGKYWLANDIDMNGISFNGSTAEFSGTLDGNHKKITNYHVTGESKTGAFFGKLLEGGVVKNLVIMNSSFNSKGEAAAFIASYGHGGTTFSNLTFINTIINQTASSYAGLLYADNQNNASSLPVKIENIVVKNDKSNTIVASAYAGVLIGHIRDAQTVNMKNIYIDTVLETKGNVAGALVGRIQKEGTTLNVEDFVFTGNIQGVNYIGGIVGQSDVSSTITLKNVSFDDATILGTGSTVDFLVGRKANGIDLTVTAVFHTESLKVFASTNKPVALLPSETTKVVITETWFNESLFDKLFFLYVEGEIQPNIDLGPSEVIGIVIANGSYDEFFIKDADTVLNFDNLEVYLAYSDGQTILLQKDEYQIDQGSFDPTQTGTYEIIVTYLEYEARFTVQVVEITELIAYTFTQKTVFKVGDTIDEAALNKTVFNAEITNGDTILIEDDLTYDFSLVKTVPGNYKVKVIYKGIYETTIDVTIIANYIQDNDATVEIFVDHAVEVSGLNTDGVIVVKTIKEAFNILEGSNLKASTIKKVYIKNGTYFEKLSLNIPNVHLIGESQAQTIIDYDAASGSLTPELGTWGTQGSATFTVNSNAKGFIAHNLTFSNSFDYYGSNIKDKQAVALVTQADQAIFYQVSFLGLQDTLYAKDGRQWYLDVYVEGIIDYVFGNGGPAFFENSEFKTLQRLGTSANGVITAQKGIASDKAGSLLKYGYVFYNSRFTASDDMTTTISLGRPWGKDAAVTYINSDFHDKVSSKGWDEMSDNKPENARFFEYNNKKGAIPFETTIGKQLTAEEAALYSDKDVVFGTENGSYTFETTWNYEAQLNLVR